jgi:DNA-binding transcriptional LysR family regulator
MQGASSMNSLWAYLPAFRAVAETEHLPTAAEILHVVPSALSRSVRLLEEALGVELFARRGRRITLNSHGRALLDALRSGMLSVERGVERATGAAFQGELNVGAIGVLTNEIVLPVVLDLVAKRPAIVPALRTCGAKEANHRLILGSLDLAFYYDAVPLDGISCTKLGSLGAHVYCGKAHPLFHERNVSKQSLLAHPFSIPQIGDRNISMDGWPVEMERKVGLRIELLVTNLAVCLSGRFLTVLPDVIAEPHVSAKRLRRFNFELLPPIDVYGACREGDEDSEIQRALIDAVAARLHTLSTPKTRRSTSARKR